MDNSQKTSYEAGHVKGQTDEKTKNMMEKAGDAGQQAKVKAGEAVEGVKKATGISKPEQTTGEKVQTKADNAADGAKNATGMKK